MGHHPPSRRRIEPVRQAALAVALALAGCAAAPPIAPAGNGAFLVSRQAATGLGGMGDLRAEALQAAAAHCGAKQLEVLETRESHPPFTFGNYPRIDITFRCT